MIYVINSAIFNIPDTGETLVDLEPFIAEGQNREFSNETDALLFEEYGGEA